jgi:hypothetical protein
MSEAETEELLAWIEAALEELCDLNTPALTANEIDVCAPSGIVPLHITISNFSLGDALEKLGQDYDHPGPDLGNDTCPGDGA